MKKKHWHLILEPDMKAPMSGIYVFSIRNDNHLSYECHKMNEGDSFYAAAGSPYNDPTRWFVPIAFHFCKDFTGSSDTTKPFLITENSWYPCNSDIDTDGLRLVAFTLKGVLTYDVIGENCATLIKHEECLKIEDGCLCSDYDFTYQDIHLLAYHYVEFFYGKRPFILVERIQENSS